MPSAREDFAVALGEFALAVAVSGAGVEDVSAILAAAEAYRAAALTDLADDLDRRAGALDVSLRAGWYGHVNSARTETWREAAGMARQRAQSAPEAPGGIPEGERLSPHSPEALRAAQGRAEGDGPCPSA